MRDEDVDRQLARLTRRGFLTAGIAAAAGFGAYKWLRSRPRIDGVEWPLRRALEMNESLAETYFSPKRLSPTFRASAIMRPRVNGHLGLTADADPAKWRLTVEGAANPVSLTLDDIKSLPVQEMVTELRCIEGWSVINKWTGARMSDLIAAFPPKDAARFVALETPGRGYYVGLEMTSAMHPQTLLAWALNDQPLNWHHGAPLRLAIPIKYGIKNIKRIGTIRYTNVRPADFWAERGYDWYAGH
jgi:DMSO/TMAO reductase YedYZ molybdopterin-dependent catalytic subunit